MSKIKISEAGTLKLLQSINIHKATGSDSIPGRLLKTCAEEIAPIYKILFQNSLDQGIVPDDWKKANIVPVFKKGYKQLPENYRPISLTSISSKLLEHIIHTNIMIHLDTNNLLSPSSMASERKETAKPN